LDLSIVQGPFSVAAPNPNLTIRNFLHRCTSSAAAAPLALLLLLPLSRERGRNSRSVCGGGGGCCAPRGCQLPPRPGFHSNATWDSMETQSAPSPSILNPFIINNNLRSNNEGM
jgi:hypothetical protein